MAWRRSPRSGLLLPRERRPFNPAASLSQGLQRLWVPALGLTPAGIENLVPDYPALMAASSASSAASTSSSLLDNGQTSFDSTAVRLDATGGGAGTVPTLTTTDFGQALAFDGVDDYLVVQGSAYQAPVSFPATMAVAFRLDSIPSVTSTIYAFCAVNAGFTLEINVRPGRTRIIFTGDANATATAVDIAATPTPGQVVLLVGTLDSFTGGRLSLFEPATGRFLTGTTTAGTTTDTAAANPFDYEVLGGWYGGGAPSSYTPVAILDAWYWNRALSDDEIATWRQDRWSVLAPPRLRTLAYEPTVATVGPSLDADTATFDANAITLDGRQDLAPPTTATFDALGITFDATAPTFDNVSSSPIVGRTAGATQTLLLPTQTATAKVIVKGSQAITLLPVIQTTSTSQVGAIQQNAVLPLPTQTATARVTVQAQQGAANTFAPQPVRFDRDDVTFDATGARFDSGINPGSFRLDSDAVSLDTASVTLDYAVPVSGLLLPLPIQTARATAPRPGVSAVQTLALPTQVATAAALVNAAAVQALPLPTQSAVVEPQAPFVSNLAANQVLSLPSTTATATVRVAAQASQTLPRVTQVASASRSVAVTATAVQLLPSIIQTAVAVPFVPPVVIGPDLPDAPVVEPEIPRVTGDLEDMIARQAAVLPPWWGAPGTVPPVLRLPLAMAGSVGSWLYDLIGYARLQTRIRTATGGWLDLIADDFFGSRIRRRAGQNDEAFRKRILVEMFRPRATRPAMVAVLKDLTGYEPRIFEPSRPQDVGGIGIGGGMGIGVSGAIGSIGLPGEVFVDVYRDPDFGIPYAAGIGSSAGGIGVPSRLVVSSLDQVAGALRDEDVFAAVEATRPVGVIAWTRISLGERGGQALIPGITPQA